jgi:hypothetical protein
MEDSPQSTITKGTYVTSPVSYEHSVGKVQGRATEEIFPGRTIIAQMFFYFVKKIKLGERDY